MMEEKNSLFAMIRTIFVTYGIMVVLFVILNILIGEEAKDFSSLFVYGNRAFSMATLIQLFALSLIISICRNVLFSDRWIKNMSIMLRNVLFFLIITVTITLFVILFAWFPIDDISAWSGFFISFALCSVVGVLVSRWRERAENDKMNKALERYRKADEDRG
ncbi:MAG: DUF3021 family protein [Lachnospiraceae bacterium]|nr:DUF3021 family protein [Lachnospiraceae bacterium]